MILTKIVSSLEKCFLDESIDKFEELKSISALKNERLFVQLLYTDDIEHDDSERDFTTPLSVSFSGALAPFATMRTVGHVPVTLAIFGAQPDDNYLRTAPGVYPDVLLPLHYHGCITAQQGATHSAWIELDLTYTTTCSHTTDTPTPTPTTYTRCSPL